METLVLSDFTNSEKTVVIKRNRPGEVVYYQNRKFYYYYGGGAPFNSYSETFTVKNEVPDDKILRSLKAVRERSADALTEIKSISDIENPSYTSSGDL